MVPHSPKPTIGGLTCRVKLDQAAHRQKTDGSFLACLGYGYLDTWHGAATLVLLPCFVLGLVRPRSLLRKPASLRSLFSRLPINE